MASTRTAAHESRRCASCCKRLVGWHFPMRLPTHGCDHDNDICLECIEQWIHVCVENQYQPRINCPHAGCDSFMFRADLRRLGEGKDVNQFLAKTHKITHDRNPNWRQCLSPKCDHGMPHVSPTPELATEPDIYRCIKGCQSKACVKCDRPWHEEMSCGEFNKGIAGQREQEAADREYLEGLKRDGTIKECPNCSCAVEREMPVSMLRCGRCLYYIRFTAPTEAQTKKTARVSAAGEALAVTFAENM